MSWEYGFYLTWLFWVFMAIYCFVFYRVLIRQHAAYVDKLKTEHKIAFQGMISARDKHVATIRGETTAQLKNAKREYEEAVVRIEQEQKKAIDADRAFTRDVASRLLSKQTAEIVRLKIKCGETKDLAPKHDVRLPRKGGA